jgi:hypothetical protein
VLIKPIIRPSTVISSRVLRTRHNILRSVTVQDESYKGMDSGCQMKSRLFILKYQLYFPFSVLFSDNRNLRLSTDNIKSHTETYADTD